MAFRLLAELTVLLHFAFVLFVVAGGVLALRWPAAAYVHIPAAVWGALIEFAGWICPLTPVEKWFRRQAGIAGYEGGFIENYILPVLYPGGLTRTIQLALGALVIAVNVGVYVIVVRRRRA